MEDGEARLDCVLLQDVGFVAELAIRIVLLQNKELDEMENEDVPKVESSKLHCKINVVCSIFLFVMFLGVHGAS